MPGAADMNRSIPNVDRERPVPWSYRVWKGLRILRRDDVRFGIKVGVGAALFVSSKVQYVHRVNVLI